jgi:hypothetical protein
MVTDRGSAKRDIRPAHDDENREWSVDLNTGREIHRCKSKTCRKWFIVSRSHAKTCSPACRKALSRQLLRNKV